MLKEHNIAYTYREYTKEPLSIEEITDILTKLDMGVFDLLRTREANKVGMTMNESEQTVIAMMAKNPLLIQRPIVIKGDTAVIARPCERLLTLL